MSKLSLFFLRFLTVFLVTMLVIIFSMFCNLYFQVDWIDRAVNVALVVANVIGFLLSFYIIHSSIKLKGVHDWWLLLFLIGIFVFCVNGVNLYLKIF